MKCECKALFLYEKLHKSLLLHKQKKYKASVSTEGHTFGKRINLIIFIYIVYNYNNKNSNSKKIIVYFPIKLKISMYPLVQAWATSFYGGPNTNILLYKSLSKKGNKPNLNLKIVGSNQCYC